MRRKSEIKQMELSINKINMKTIIVKISGRKEKNYPTSTFEVQFSNVTKLLVDIDKLIDETQFRKVDVSVDDLNNVLNDDDVIVLNDNYILV